MLFLVKHIDGQRHRRMARVSAVSNRDAMDQAERAWGTALGMTCLRMETRPVLRLVQPQRAPARAGLALKGRP